MKQATITQGNAEALWKAECPDCGWHIVEYMNRPEYGGDALPQEDRRKLFERIVRGHPCMCEPHRFSVGERFDKGPQILKLDWTHKPAHVWLTDKSQPGVGKRMTIGDGKMFQVTHHHDDGSISLAEGAPLRGPRAR